MVGLASLKFDFEIRLRNYESQIEFPADPTVMEHSIIFLTASLAGFISLPACGRAQLEQELLCLPDLIISGVSGSFHLASCCHFLKQLSQVR